MLAHWNNSPQVDMSLHSDTLFWFHYYCYLIKFNFAVIFKMLWLFPCLCFFYIQLVCTTLIIAYHIYVLTVPLFTFSVFYKWYLQLSILLVILYIYWLSSVYIFCFFITGTYNSQYCLLSCICIDCSLFTLFVFYNWYIQLSILLVILYIYIYWLLPCLHFPSLYNWYLHHSILLIIL